MSKNRVFTTVLGWPTTCADAANKWGAHYQVRHCVAVVGRGKTKGKQCSRTPEYGHLLCAPHKKILEKATKIAEKEVENTEFWTYTKARTRKSGMSFMLIIQDRKTKVTRSGPIFYSDDGFIEADVENIVATLNTRIYNKIMHPFDKHRQLERF